MERYVYLSHIGVDFEGSGVAGIHTTLEEAKSFLERERVELKADKPEYFDNSFFIIFWDTQKQEVVYHWDMDRETGVWESQGQAEIRWAKECWTKKP